MNWWENTGWKEYLNRDWGFRIKNTDQLRLYEDRGSRTLTFSRLFSSNNVGSKNFGTLIVSSQSIEKGTTLEKLTETSVEIIHKTESDTLVSVNKIMISNDMLEAREIIDQTKQTQYSRVTHVLTIKNDIRYDIFWFILDTELEKQLGFFKLMVKSFVFI
jgi:hypothetical protein